MRDDGVERKLWRIGPVTQPVGWSGGAGLVVENDLAGWLSGVSFPEGAVDAIDTDVEAQRADLHIAQGLFARLDGEGRAFNGLVVEPQAEQLRQALTLSAEVGAGPAGCGVGVVLGEDGVNKPAEQGGTLVERQVLERGLRLNRRPEASRTAWTRLPRSRGSRPSETVSSAEEKRRFSAKARKPRATCDCRMAAPP